MKNKVFVIGNGESRKEFDLNVLKEHGKIYGCNALYRDFSPDVLVSNDIEMIVELIESKYCKDNACVFSDWNIMPGEAYDMIKDDITNTVSVGSGDKFSVFGTEEKTYVLWTTDENIEKFSNHHMCVDTGTISLFLASQDLDVSDVYMLGFDIKDTLCSGGKNNNIYKDTDCYQSSDDLMSSKKQIKWSRDNASVFMKYPHINYHRVHNTKTNPFEWTSVDNVDCISYSDFESILDESLLRAE